MALGALNAPAAGRWGGEFDALFTRSIDQRFNDLGGEPEHFFVTPCLHVQTGTAGRSAAVRTIFKLADAHREKERVVENWLGGAASFRHGWHRRMRCAVYP